MAHFRGLFGAKCFIHDQYTVDLKYWEILIIWLILFVQIIPFFCHFSSIYKIIHFVGLVLSYKFSYSGFINRKLTSRKLPFLNCPLTSDRVDESWVAVPLSLSLSPSLLTSDSGRSVEVVSPTPPPLRVDLKLRILKIYQLGSRDFSIPDSGIENSIPGFEIYSYIHISIYSSTDTDIDFRKISNTDTDLNYRHWPNSRLATSERQVNGYSLQGHKNRNADENSVWFNLPYCVTTNN